MKYCQYCEKEYEDDVLYCEECGQKLVEQGTLITDSGKCPLCGTKCKAGQNFCPHCGTSLTGGGETGTIVVHNMSGFHVSMQVLEQTYVIKYHTFSMQKPLTVQLPAASYHLLFSCGGLVQTFDVTLNHKATIYIVCKIEGARAFHQGKLIVTAE